MTSERQQIEDKVVKISKMDKQQIEKHLAALKGRTGSDVPMDDPMASAAAQIEAMIPEIERRADALGMERLKKAQEQPSATTTVAPRAPR